MSLTDPWADHRGVRGAVTGSKQKCAPEVSGGSFQCLVWAAEIRSGAIWERSHLVPWLAKTVYCWTSLEIWFFPQVKVFFHDHFTLQRSEKEKGKTRAKLVKQLEDWTTSLCIDWDIFWFFWSAFQYENENWTNPPDQKNDLFGGWSIESNFVS